MTPVGRDLSHRRQHKAPLMHAGMRQDQLVRRGLVNGGHAQRHQPLYFRLMRGYLVAVGNQVKIAASRLPPLLSDTAQFGLNFMQLA